jgi:poly-gamma-glutamate synthesis protein (capsule biosynthesis protein)
MSDAPRLTLCLGGDLMTGRGVDQAFARACDPRLFERAATSALDYVALAEAANGPIPRPVSHDYVWGDALAVLERVRPDARIVNLETSVTTSPRPEPKGINYRMHPANAPVLTAARIDCVTLANNHVLDWGPDGLLETLDTLGCLNVRAAGAGRDLEQADAPAVIPVGAGSRVLVLAFATTDCGVPPWWAAAADRPGVHLLPDLSERTVSHLAALVERARKPGDVVVASVHWGNNWGYDVPRTHRRFAHALVGEARVDVVFGHSPHHPKAIEVYHGRPILYGCGDLLDDYEGIRGHAEYRSDLVLLYWVTLDAATGELARLAMTPFRVARFRLAHATAEERAWLRATLDRECERFGHRVSAPDDELVLDWT